MGKTLKKLTAAERDAEVEARLQAQEAHHNKYAHKEFDATIHWFDGLSGEGFVKLEDGSSWYLNFTAVEGIDRHNMHWPRQEDVRMLEGLAGRACRVRLYVSAGMVSVCKLTDVPQTKK